VNCGAAGDNEGEEADLVVVAVLVLTAAGSGGVEEESHGGQGISDSGFSSFFSMFACVFFFSLFLFSCFYVSSSISDDGGAAVDGGATIFDWVNLKSHVVIPFNPN